MFLVCDGLRLRGVDERSIMYRGAIVKFFFCLTLTVVYAAAPCLAGEAHDARILFINSYHHGYSWSDGIEQGFRERIDATGRKVEISFEYLDSRQFPLGAHLDHVARSMAVKYADYRPNLVAVSDNAAFDFAIRNRERLFPGLPIVFSGYNNFRPDIIDGIANITGVNEEVDIPDTVEMALKVHPGTHTLVFILSTADASNKRMAEVAERSTLPKLRERFDIVVLKDAPLEEVRRRLEKLPRKTVVFLCGQISDDLGAGRALTPMENGRLVTANSPFPTYTFWDFHLNTGVIGGHILTGQDQGRLQAELALRVLAGTPADTIPVVMTSPTSDIFDYRVMERFGVKPGNLPLNSIIINHPSSPWESYRWQILGIMALLALETLLIAVLVRITRDRRRALDDLAQERKSLERRVDERTAELKMANEQLALLSFKDGLTGLANRRRFDEVLEGEILRLARSGQPLSLIILDVDSFKNFNDTYGHVAGDDCLRRVGGLIDSLVNRPPDLAARYGGEEFTVILPETNSQGAARLAEHIRVGIEQLAIPHATSRAADHITASLGVATVFPSALTAGNDLVKLADEQLYRAKSAGRNRLSADVEQAAVNGG